MKTASEKLIEMDSKNDSDKCLCVSPTVWRDDSKRFVCGLVLTHSNPNITSEDELFEVATFGATMDDAINNYYDEYFVK